MAETAKGTVLSEVKFDGVIYRAGDKLEAPKDTIKRLIRIGVVEDPAVAKAALDAAKADTAEAEAQAKVITDDAEAAALATAADAEDKAKKVIADAETEAADKAKTVTDQATAEADKLVAAAKAEASKIAKDAQEAAKATQTNKTSNCIKVEAGTSHRRQERPIRAFFVTERIRITMHSRHRVSKPPMLLYGHIN